MLFLPRLSSASAHLHFLATFWKAKAGPRPNGVMQLSLGTGTVALSDGFTSFNQSAEDALNVWNQYLAHLKFAVVRNSPVTPAENDDEMSVFFSDTVFGDRFGLVCLRPRFLATAARPWRKPTR